MEQTFNISNDVRLDSLAEYGFQIDDTPDFRELPSEGQISHGMLEIVSGLTTLFEDSRLEEELEPLLYNVINLFHRRVDQLERLLDQNELSQQDLIRAQDGSEVLSVELETMTHKGQLLTESRNVFEVIRDIAASHFATVSGTNWIPPRGRQVNHTTNTAAILESRAFIEEKKAANKNLNLPSGTKIGFAGSQTFSDIETIEAVLKTLHKKYPDMILCHTNTKGSDQIAMQWALKNKVTAIAFTPNWKAGNAAPFKRNDDLLSCDLKGIIAIPHNGIVKNLIQKAEKSDVPVYIIKGV